VGDASEGRRGQRFGYAPPLSTDDVGGASPGAYRCGIAAAWAPQWVGLARAVGGAAAGVDRSGRPPCATPGRPCRCRGVGGGCDGRRVRKCWLAFVSMPLPSRAWLGAGGQCWQEPHHVRAASTLARRLPHTPRRRHALQPAAVCTGCTDASRPTPVAGLCPPLCPLGCARPHNISCSMRRSHRASSAASAASSSAPAATASFRMVLTSRACQS